MTSLCNGCTKVFEKVYKKRVHKLIPNFRSKCEVRKALFGESWVKMYVRQCPFAPEFYLSEGNGNGWVFVYVPLDPRNSNNLKFEVHLGEFDELLLLENKRPDIRRKMFTK